MSVIAITSIDQFNEMLKEKVPTVVHFYADWSQQCKVMNEILHEYAQQPNLIVRFAKLIAEDFPDLCDTYKCSAVPLFLFMEGGTVFERLEGADAPKLSEKIRNLIEIDKMWKCFANPKIKYVRGSMLDPPNSPILQGDSHLTARLKLLINRHRLMLFMKGTPSEPKCGFSRTIVGLLDGLHVQYKHFDILTDSEVREGLKKFSNWPTYPQLYLNGELIGGLDIVKEFISSGELQEMLSKAVQDRLTTLINKAHVMVFMKGDPKEPKCGFSQQIIQILDETRVQYETFDILKDDEVREGLKTHSNWPTYPQLYVNGHLIGGLDIVRELKESQMLMQTLANKEQKV